MNIQVKEGYLFYCDFHLCIISFKMCSAQYCVVIGYALSLALVSLFLNVHFFVGVYIPVLHKHAFLLICPHLSSRSARRIVMGPLS